MRKIIILALVIIGLQTQAQKKHDNTIIINKKVSLDTLKQILFDKGYVITNNDSTFIYTDNSNIKFIINRKDSSTTFKGFYNAGYEVTIGMFTSKSEFTQIEFIGMKGSDAKIAWNKLDALAKSISNDITYLKQ